MVGIDALVEQRLMMDFEKRVIKVEDARQPAMMLDGEIVVTARRRRGQLILTQVKAAGLPVEAVIDTGTEISISVTTALVFSLAARARASLMSKHQPRDVVVPIQLRHLLPCSMRGGTRHSTGWPPVAVNSNVSSITGNMILAGSTMPFSRACRPESAGISPCTRNTL